MATIPAAPKFLPDEIQKKWSAAYANALKQAMNDFPGDESKQHAEARKEANRILAVPAPESAAEILKMPEWQIHKDGNGNPVRGTRPAQAGGQEVFCVTIDGRKYAFAVQEKAKGKGAKDGDDKTGDDTK